MNDIVPVASTIPVVSDATINDYLASMGNKLTQFHRNQFIQICKAFNLNPFIREIYGIPFGDKFNIIVGYEVYLKRAERSGLLAGWRAWTEGEGKAMKGCVEIKRKDWSSPFYHEALISEYDQGNSMWKSKPATMIKKVAIAQGFRMCFPENLGGMPYTADEIESVPVVVNPAERFKSAANPPALPAEVLATPEQLTELSKLLIANGYADSNQRKQKIHEMTGKQVKQLTPADIDYLMTELSVVVPAGVDPATGEILHEEPKASTCPECGDEWEHGACRNMTCPEGRPYAE